MGTIQIQTSVPGPKSKELVQRRESAVPRGLSHTIPIYVTSAEGATLEDVDGNRYIDFAGGIGCLNVGHRAPGVISAIRAQLDRFLHTSVQVTAVRKLRTPGGTVKRRYSGKVSQEDAVDEYRG